MAFTCVVLFRRYVEGAFTPLVQPVTYAALRLTCVGETLTRLVDAVTRVVVPAMCSAEAFTCLAAGTARTRKACAGFDATLSCFARDAACRVS